MKEVVVEFIAFMWAVLKEVVFEITFMWACLTVIFGLTVFTILAFIHINEWFLRIS